MKQESLATKLNNPEFVESLSERRRRELLVCQKLLSEEELEQESSIQVAYKKARKKFIEEYLDQINPELAEHAREKKVPIFGILETLERNANAC